MPEKDAHNKAAELHENAAKSHRAAADQHGKSDHVKGKEHSTNARAAFCMYVNRASKLTLKVSNKSNASVRTKESLVWAWGFFYLDWGCLLDLTALQHRTERRKL